MFENKEYFGKYKFKNPDDYVVRSYVMPKIKFMEENSCFRKGMRILDVGSGNGTFSWYFQKYSDRIVGIDNSEFLLKSNPCQLKAIADAYQLPFADNQFDIVFEANLLHHLDRPDAAIKEMSRCSNEYLIFIEPNRYNPLMLFFSLFVKAERGALASYRNRWERMIKNSGIQVINGMVSGMISQQNTPAFMIPFLRWFDFDFWLGEYIILVCKKNNV